ncbi:DUF1697 domain-containing protein [Gordonia sp. (in: high G+C Gram-positive bacteria)]|uniref:DUF1697 domain-containing protein n=1 Tax=Gordonia sp. (in: high G+C Gram-positive bacteria) TaxID=84139 RepID=UPI001D993A52|nr:DUF1697 domain-containing protein [Gordonia sp. (in: high G+C Gram-positive bacteria)]MCB1296695.1 DUF1697 domain-containing protein [Gordonia sp. (in: high G+C Gram-positive bacteria)]HMS75219.1 DUF1697 domain-containing protein [Gordonia sp. (in: high G+C Gram-positive bacteria)]HQV17950.1 DUF1697 domain-containing protein [Gordonia sp. (in: high G+C Gram-positive bacteria)]
MSRRVVLIRAVNVGGTAKLPMAELRDVAQSLGASDVSTYIASGNLFCVPPGDPAEFDRALESAIETRYGYFREVISRSIDELRAAVDAHPFEVVDEKLNYLYPLTGTPEPEKVQALVAKPFDDTRIEVIGADLHIRYGVGVAASKLTPPLIARTLGVTGTGRNWRTVGKLIELAG